MSGKAKDQDRDDKLKRKDYEKELRKLQVELCWLQDWVKSKGLRVIIIFEGRDAADEVGGEEPVAGGHGPPVLEQGGVLDHRGRAVTTAHGHGEHPRGGAAEQSRHRVPIGLAERARRWAQFQNSRLRTIRPQ